MKWTEHETTAHADPKVRKLLRKHGAAAYGLYWFIVELIGQGITADNPENGYLPTDVDGEFLALELGMEQEDVKAILNYAVSIDLFQREGAARLKCDALLSRCGGYTRKKLAKSVGQSRTVSDKVGHIQEVSAHPSISSSESSSSKIPKIPKTFDEFWELYPLKKGKQAALMKYKIALKSVDHARLIAGVRRYIGELKRDGTEAQFIAHPATWLHQGRWDDETGVKLVEAEKPRKVCPACGEAAPNATTGSCLECGLEKTEWVAYRETHPEAHV